jgi:hypothetical protein
MIVITNPPILISNIATRKILDIPVSFAAVGGAIGSMTSVAVAVACGCRCGVAVAMP